MLCMTGAPAPAKPRLVGLADLITGVRLPLAVLFPLVGDWTWRLGFVLLAGFTDWLDGIVARKLGPSRIGVVLDPIADKAFMLSAFITVVGVHAFDYVTIWELFAVLIRDFVAIAVFVIAVVGKWPTRTLPARLSGKLTTVGQFLVLVALLVDWPPLRPALRPLVWATALVSAYSVIDYYREGKRVDAAKLAEAHTHGNAGPDAG